MKQEHLLVKENPIPAVSPNGYYIHIEMGIPEPGYTRSQLSMTYDNDTQEPFFEIESFPTRDGNWNLSTRNIKPEEADNFLQAALVNLRLPSELDRRHYGITKTREDYLSDICKATVKVHKRAIEEIYTIQSDLNK